MFPRGIHATVHDPPLSPLLVARRSLKQGETAEMEQKTENKPKKEVKGEGP